MLSRSNSANFHVNSLELLAVAHDDEAIIARLKSDTVTGTGWQFDSSDRRARRGVDRDELVAANHNQHLTVIRHGDRRSGPWWQLFLP